MGIYNIGTTVETTIAELARKMAGIAGYDIEITQADRLREGDALRRRPDISKLAALGYQPRVDLNEGLRKTMEGTR